jgi:uncharacterized protein YciI
MDIKSLLESIPTPTEEEMAARRHLARPYTLVLLRKGLPVNLDEAAEKRMQLEHLQHLTKCQLSGKLVLNGPVLVEHDVVGVSIYAAEPDEARALAEADPKVRDRRALAGGASLDRRSHQPASFMIPVPPSSPMRWAAAVLDLPGN